MSKTKATKAERVAEAARALLANVIEWQSVRHGVRYEVGQGVLDALEEALDLPDDPPAATTMKAERVAEAAQSLYDACMLLSSAGIKLASRHRDVVFQQWDDAMNAYHEARQLPDDPPAGDATEALAALEHEQWMAWANTLMEKEPLLSAERVARWKTLMVPYAELSEEMKEHDRKWARKALALIPPAGDAALLVVDEALRLVAHYRSIDTASEWNVNKATLHTRADRLLAPPPAAKEQP